MSELTAKRVLLATFLLSLVAITYYDLKGQGNVVKTNKNTKTGVTSFSIGSTAALPNPREFISAGLVFGLLGVLAVASPPLAAALGAGTLLGIATSRANKASAANNPGAGSLAGTLDLGTTAPLTVTSPGSTGTGTRAI